MDRELLEKLIKELEADAESLEIPKNYWFWLYLNAAKTSFDAGMLGITRLALIDASACLDAALEA